jgi:phospholipase C
MQENRSFDHYFDHYFGTLRGVRGRPTDPNIRTSCGRSPAGSTTGGPARAIPCSATDLAPHGRD